MKRTSYLLAGLVLFLATSEPSWALGVPGFPALNTAFGLVSAFLVGIVEAYLVSQLIFAFAQMHHGQPGAKDKVIWIMVAMLAVPFAPPLGSYLYNLFFSTGASPATNVWNGQ